MVLSENDLFKSVKDYTSNIPHKIRKVNNKAIMFGCLILAIIKNLSTLKSTKLWT